MATEQDGGRAEDIDYRSVFEHSSDAILVHDTGLATVLDPNRAAGELFDTDSDTLCERSLADLRSRETAGEQTPDLLQQALSEGGARTEWEIEQSDGTRWVDVRVTDVGDGTALTYLRDLTERRKLEVDLQRERGLTERVLDTTPTGIVVHDAVEVSADFLRR
jgi:PAS domain S-box-containing protein